MSFDILIWSLKQKNDWGIIIFWFLCISLYFLYFCRRIFLFLYILFLFFFDGPSPLRLRACMISKTIRWCFQHLQFFFSKIISFKFTFYVFHDLSTFDLNSLPFLSFIQQHLIATRIKNNLRHLVGPYPNHSHISSSNILSIFSLTFLLTPNLLLRQLLRLILRFLFLTIFLLYFDPIIIWIFYNWDKSQLGICIKIQLWIKKANSMIDTAK